MRPALICHLIHSVPWRAVYFFKFLFMKKRLLCECAVKAGDTECRWRSGGQHCDTSRVCLQHQQLWHAASELEDTSNISPGLLTGSNFSVFIDQIATGGEHGGCFCFWPFHIQSNSKCVLECVLEGATANLCFLSPEVSVDSDSWHGHFSQCPEELTNYCIHGNCRYIPERKAPSCR